MVRIEGMISVALAGIIAIATAAAAEGASDSSTPKEITEEEWFPLASEEDVLPKVTTIEERRAQQFGGDCHPYPFTDVPFDTSVLNFTDGSSPNCKSANSLNYDTFLNEVNGGITDIVIDPDSTSVNCNDFNSIPSVLVSMLRLSVMNEAYDLIRECLRARGIPYVLYRAPPKSGPTTELASKDGLAELVNRYTPCNNDKDECIIPETYRITEDEEECQTFFLTLENGVFANYEWILKPINSFGGQGIRIVNDFQVDLIDPYGDCSQIGTHPVPVVVQRFIMPMLIEGHNSHIRTYFSFKFGSQPNFWGLQFDPPQGWHFDAGNLHICPEPYSMVGQSAFALTCNRHLATRTDTVQLGDQTVDKTMPFPDGLSEILDPPEYFALMQKITNLFSGLAPLFLFHHFTTQTFAGNGEALWTVVAVDVVVDDTMRPWIVDINPCHKKPFYYDPDDIDGGWNPYVSIHRVVMSHYRRVLLRDRDFNEQGCEVLDLEARAHKVL